MLQVAVGLGIGVVGYNYFRSGEVPQVVARPGGFCAHILAKCEKLRAKFQPSLFFSSAHAQTIFTTLRGLNPPGSFQRQIVDAPDGGHFALDWFVPKKGTLVPLTAENEGLLRTKPEKGVLFILHGLTGSSQDGYCRDLAMEGYLAGFQPVIMTYRGCHDLQVEASPITYSAAYTGDAHLALKEIQRKYPNEPVVATGFSLGSMVLCKLLAEQGDRIEAGRPLDGARILAGALISSPVDMWQAMDKLEASFMGSFYNNVLSTKLRKYAERHRKGLALSTEISLEAVKTGKTIRDFEKSVILPLFGYASLDEYYQDGSSHLHYHRIRAPTAVLIAKDDPFLGRVPEEEVLANERMGLVTTNRGGHCAWLEGFWMRSWADRVVVEFLLRCLEEVEGAGAPVEAGVEPARRVTRSQAVVGKKVAEADMEPVGTR